MPYFDRINHQNDKYSCSSCKDSKIRHQHCGSQHIFSGLGLKGLVVSPNLVISVSQMNFVAPFSPHHQLKYLCNRSNLNVKQVCYITPPPACNHTSFVHLTLSHTHTHSPPLSHTHPFTASLDTGENRVMVCNLVLITTSDLRCDLHPSTSRASQTVRREMLM